MLPNGIHLAIIDDHTLFRKALNKYLSEIAGMQVGIQASNMFDLLIQLKNFSGRDIDVLVMDVFMPEINGLDALKTIRTEYPLLKIVVLSMSTNIEFISNLQELGIHGYISKADEPEELIQAIRAVAQGRIYRNKLFAEALCWNRQINIDKHKNRSSSLLTDREKKILQLIWEEKSNKEIADHLFLGVRSVEKIRQDIKEKIGARSTIGLLKYAFKKKIIRIGPQSSGLI